MNRFLLQAVAVSCLAILPAGCSNPLKQLQEKFNRPVEVDAFTSAVKTSLPLAYAVNCAMDAAYGRVLPGVTMNGGFDSFPCTRIVNIAVSAAHRLPVGADTTGIMTVVGYWSTRDDAVVTVFFTRCNIREGSFTLSNVAFTPVERDTDGTLVVFASEDVNGDSALAFNASAWCPPPFPQTVHWP